MKNNSSEFDLVENYFPTIYLTIIALIQGIALSTLAGNFVQEIKSGFSVTEPIYYARYIVASTIIFSTWHHYMYGIIYLRWFPSLLDTLIPLSLGAAQFVITGIIREPSQANWYYWLLSLSLFFLISGVAYLNAAVKTTPLLFTGRYGKELSGKYTKYIKLCNFLAAFSGFMHCAFTLMIAYQQIAYDMIFVVEIMLLIHAAAYEIYYKKRIKPHYLLMLHSRNDIATKGNRGRRV